MAFYLDKQSKQCLPSDTYKYSSKPKWTWSQSCYLVATIGYCDNMSQLHERMYVQLLSAWAGQTERPAAGDRFEISVLDNI